MFMESVVPSRAAATAATFGIRIFLQVCQSFIAVFEELAQTIFERRCVVETILTFMVVIERFSRCRCFFRRSRRFQCFDRKTDLAALIHAQYFYFYFVLFFQEIFHIANVNVCYFRDMNEADFTALQFDECSKIGNSGYNAFNYTANFNGHTFSISSLIYVS